MKLIVFRTMEDREKYSDLLMNGTVWQRRGPKVHQYTDGVMYICADEEFALRYLRGHAFDEVLWVGFADGMDVALEAPVDLLAQLFGTSYKSHYYKPKETTC